MSIKPEMASPTFASMTHTFSPAKWPAVEESGYTADHFPFFGPALCDFSGFNGWLFFRGSQRKFFRRFIT